MREVRHSNPKGFDENVRAMAEGGKSKEPYLLLFDNCVVTTHNLRANRAWTEVVHIGASDPISSSHFRKINRKFRRAEIVAKTGLGSYSILYRIDTATIVVFEYVRNIELHHRYSHFK